MVLSVYAAQNSSNHETNLKEIIIGYSIILGVHIAVGQLSKWILKKRMNRITNMLWNSLGSTSLNSLDCKSGKFSISSFNLDELNPGASPGIPEPHLDEKDGPRSLSSLVRKFPNLHPSREERQIVLFVPGGRLHRLFIVLCGLLSISTAMLIIFLQVTVQLRPNKPNMTKT